MAKMSSSKEVVAKNKGTRRKTQGVFKPEHESRIVRVSRNAGSKDRHSKVRTFKGLRDRRVRLCVDTAINFYDLQDRLGVEHPSDAIDWLIQTAKSSIDELRPLPTDMGSVSQITYSDGSPDEQSKKAKEISNNSSGSEGSVKPCGESCSTSKMASRDRARQNARERTKAKKEASASASASVSASVLVSVSQVSQQPQVFADLGSVFPFKNPQQSFSFGSEEERTLNQNIHMLDPLLPHSYQELLLSRDLPSSLVSSSAAVPRGFSTYMSSQDMDFGSLPCVQAKPRQLGYINSTQVHSHVKNVGHDQIRNVNFSSKMEPEEMDVEEHIQIRNNMSFSGKVEGDGMGYGAKNGEMQLGSGSSSSSFYLKNGMDMGATGVMRMYNNIHSMSMSMRRGPLQSNEKNSTTAPAGSAEIIKEYCQEEDENERDNRFLQSVCNIGHHHGYPPCSQ